MHDQSFHLPETATRSARDYLAAATKGESLFHFIIDQAMYGDFVQHTARMALDGPPRRQRLSARFWPASLTSANATSDSVKTNSLFGITPDNLLETNPGPRIKALRHMSQELLELFLASAIDNFETYVVSILREILRKEPRPLANREQNVTVEYVLKFNSIEELTNDLIEGKVNSLSYEGFKALQRWCKKKGIPLAAPDNVSGTIEELIATRNTIVHNRGLIDDKYLRTVTGSKFKKGEKREILVDDFLEATTILARIVITTDNAAVAKYGLETLPIKDMELPRAAGEHGA